ncbi:MAG: hypothetical protein SNJ57_03210 [Cyanobacteriota bacterium]
MSSPFSTFEEFSAAEGPIYTFASSPGIITFLILLSAAISLYFLYASFGMKNEFAKPTNETGAIALLIATGVSALLSLVPGYGSSQRLEANDSRPMAAKVHTGRGAALPGVLMGLASATGLATGRSKQRPRRSAARSVRRRQG